MLNVKSLITTVYGFVAIAILSIMIFSITYISAGYVYAELIIFTIIFTFSITAITIYLLINNPKLYLRRLRLEKSSTQIFIQLINAVAFFLIFILAGLSVRYDTLLLPKLSIILGIILFAISLYLLFLTYSENSYLSSNIAVEDNQKVVSTGLYKYIRHPMYSSAVLMLLSIPMILCSILSYIPIVIIILGIIFRTADEERYLIENLKGYKEYLEKVKFRFFPNIF